ncbi:MAG: thioredoxin [Candidatus Berkelbacteria bacterium]
MSEIRSIEKMADFEAMIAAGKPTIVDFHATWCGPCKMMAPIFDKMSSEYKNADKFNFAKVDIDQGREIASKYDVMSVPTFIIFDKDGQISETLVGMRSPDDLSSKLDDLLS